MKEPSRTPEISLLWPAAAVSNTHFLVDFAATDLGIHTLLERMRFRPGLRDKIRAALFNPTADSQVIQYRQEILEDFLENPALVEKVEKLLPRLEHLSYLGDFPSHTYLEEVTSRLGELEIYIDCVRMLKGMLEDPGVTPRSAGLLRLRELVQALEGGESFRELAERLPELRAKASGVRSITIGVNLDSQLRPFEATLVALNDRPFTGARDNFLSLLFGEIGSPEARRGIAQLHSAGGEMSEALQHGMKSNGIKASPLMFPLFQDLDKVMRQTMAPVAQALNEFIHLQSGFLIDLEAEFALYLAEVRLVQQMRAAGLPMSRAEIAPVEERVCQMTDLYNLLLALRTGDANTNQGSAVVTDTVVTDAVVTETVVTDTVVTNDVDFNDSGRIMILTGPNQGGKTTYTQAVGLAQALFQVGLYVPARSARISPVDAIFTHFPIEEKPQAETGRLGEEAQRLNRIFQSATRCSLVLLNESLTTTSPGESIYLARDILRALKLWGVRAIFVTHLHELAETLDELNASTEGDSRFVSLVAGADAAGPEEAARRTYKIRKAPPMGVSFAKDIARRHGISYEQLAQALKERENRST